MNWITSHEREAVSAEELAAAMRDGLERRRFHRPLPPPPPADLPPVEQFDLWRRLIPLAPVHALPAPAARRSPRSRIARVARRVAKRLLHPWLVRQAEFNDDVVCAVNHSFHVLYLHYQKLTERVNELTRLQRELTPGYEAAVQRVNECFHELYQVRRSVAEVASEPAAGPAGSSPAVIEELFVHTRIPAPPARAVVLPAARTTALDLASLGFQVVQAAPDAATPAHPSLQAVDPTGPALPLDDDGFDLAVALGGWPRSPAVVAELARVVSPGGRLIGSAGAADRAAHPAEVEAMVRPFRVTELTYATRAWDGWQLQSDPPTRPGEAVALWVAVKE